MMTTIFVVHVLLLLSLSIPFGQSVDSEELTTFETLEIELNDTLAESANISTSTPLSTIRYTPSLTIECGEGQVESNCTNSCQPTCENQDREPCRHSYCWRGCECQPGYVLNRQNWTCIPKESCPVCGQNEHYRDCGPDCQPKCTDYQSSSLYCRQYACLGGCYCDFGYVRDVSRNGSCVRIDECPQRCGPNEYYELSGKPCRRTHLDPRPKCLESPREPSCVCNTGFIRDPFTQECEPLSTTAEKCGANETFSYCGSECAQKCYNDYALRRFCPTICLRGCFCDDGFVMDADTHVCVLPEDCVGKYHYN